MTDPAVPTSSPIRGFADTLARFLSIPKRLRIADDSPQAVAGRPNALPSPPARPAVLEGQGGAPAQRQPTNSVVLPSGKPLRYMTDDRDDAAQRLDGLARL